MFRELPLYASTRRTTLPWAVDIPSHWQVGRAKSIMRALDVRSDAGEEELLTVSSSRGVVPRASAQVNMFKAESYAGHKLCWPGDLVINSLWAWGRGLGVAQHHGIVSTAYGVYRQHGDALNADYLHQLVRSEPFQWELQVRSQGVWKSRLQITDDRWLDAPLLVPTHEEQAAIVKYLAHANARIDKAIAAKRRLITLVEQASRTFVNDALGPHNAVDWTCVALKRVLNTPITDGPHETPDFVEEGVPFASVEAAHHGRINLEDCRGYISRERHEEYCRKVRPRRDDILIVKSGSTTGKTVLVDTDDDFSIWSPLALVRCGPLVRPKFLYLYLTSAWFQMQVRDRWSFGTQPNIGMNVLKDLLIRFPGLEEQSRIVDSIEVELNSLNRQTQLAEAEISLIQEFRTRLVADVVTGQVDVRAIAATLPDAPESFDNVDSATDDDLEEALSEGEE